MLNGFYLTIPTLGVNLFFLTILSAAHIYEIHRSKSCSKKKSYRRRRRNNDQTKITIIITTLCMLIAANIGCAADLVHVTFCYLASNVQDCTSEFDIERLIADISYWIAYISLYFIIVSRLYVTFINTRYRLSPCITFILILLMFICYMACASMLILGYFNDDKKNDLNDISLISFLLFDFILNTLVLMLFIIKMNKVIINKTYRVASEDLDDGTGFNNNDDDDNNVFISNVSKTSIDFESHISHSLSFNDLILNNNNNNINNHQKDINIMDNQQVTLTTVVTRLTLLTLLAIFFNVLFALFLLYYYLYTYIMNVHIEDQRDYGITYCGRAIIAAINGLLTLLNFNFCHRKYYQCCRCCHKSLFRCFVKRNAKSIKGLSMHLDIERNTSKGDFIGNSKSIRFSMNNSIGKLSSISVFSNNSTESTEFDYFSD